MEAGQKRIKLQLSGKLVYLVIQSINNANRLLDICKDLSTEEIYNELNVFL